MTELNEAATLSRLPSDIAAPSYDRRRLKRGIANLATPIANQYDLPEEMQ